jgi:hypothetical protein
MLTIILVPWPRADSIMTFKFTVTSFPEIYFSKTRASRILSGETKMHIAAADEVKKRMEGLETG